MNKGISNLKIILIIAISAFVLIDLLFGIFLIWRYSQLNEEKEIQESEQEVETTEQEKEDEVEMHNLVVPQQTESEETAEKRKMDLSIKADLSSLRAVGELYAVYNNESYSGLCISEDVLRIKNSIKENDSIMECSDLADKWVACAQLHLNPSNFFCVDFKGDAREVESTICDKSFVVNLECHQSAKIRNIFRGE